MRIELENVSKRYRLEWIFKKVNQSFLPKEQYAITGPNGSGKSTLLKILSGHLSPSKGKVRFFDQEKAIDPNEVYRHVSYAAPYIELLEEFTLTEAINLHGKFKSFLHQLQTKDLIDILGFQKSKNKPIRHFSSGMKQRLKLVLSICSDTPLLLLDEPTTNLDTQGINWYRQLIATYAKDRLVVIASNVDVDFDFCEHKVNILDYK